VPLESRVAPHRVANPMAVTDVAGLARGANVVQGVMTTQADRHWIVVKVLEWTAAAEARIAVPGDDIGRSQVLIHRLEAQGASPLPVRLDPSASPQGVSIRPRGGLLSTGVALPGSPSLEPCDWPRLPANRAGSVQTLVQLEGSVFVFDPQSHSQVLELVSRQEPKGSCLRVLREELLRSSS
jgi:hypothetical protein